MADSVAQVAASCSSRCDLVSTCDSSSGIPERAVHLADLECVVAKSAIKRCHCARIVHGKAVVARETVDDELLDRGIVVDSFHILGNPWIVALQQCDELAAGEERIVLSRSVERNCVVTSAARINCVDAIVARARQVDGVLIGSGLAVQVQCVLLSSRL